LCFYSRITETHDQAAQIGLNSEKLARRKLPKEPTMKTNNFLIRGAFLLLTVVGLGIVQHASAGTIFLSGDSNITNPLVGSSGVPVGPGNQQFFGNVLAGGGTVVVLDCVCGGSPSSVSNADGEVNTFYNTLGGVNSSLHGGPVTVAALTGADLFVVPLPDDAFTGSEISAMNSFIAGSGSIFFLGENSSPVFTTNNAAINAALASLGSGLSILPDFIDTGFNTAVGTQIAADPFTAGVAEFVYGATSQVAGGTQVFSGFEGDPFVTYEGKRTPAVPEPGTLLLLGLALAGLWLAMRWLH
jgi:hypothetical protein